MTRLRADENDTGIGFGRQPPPKGGPRPRAWSRDWEFIANQCRTHPLEWYMIGETLPISLANALRDGKIILLHPEMGFEITTANNSPRGERRTCDIWIRHNPEKENE